MAMEKFFGRCWEQARLADDSGSWHRWVQAQSALAQVASAAELVEVVQDREQPSRANELLLALVRVGSSDGGVDERAATFVASLLAPGANRMIRGLSSLGPEVDGIVAGQLWLQVRDYPWRVRPRAVAKNTLMDTRRAVLRDYGASTYRRAALVPIASPEQASTGDHALERVKYEQLIPDLALLHLLVWATAWGVLRNDDAVLLWELVLVDAEFLAGTSKPLRGGGAGSERAAGRLAGTRGVDPRTVRRHRDLAVSALRVAREDFRGDFDIGPAVGAQAPKPRALRTATPRKAATDA